LIGKSISHYFNCREILTALGNGDLKALPALS